MQPQQIELHAEGLEQEGISLYATTFDQQRQEMVDIHENWTAWAFLWHQSSYYGTHIKQKVVGNRRYVLLTHSEAYDFFLHLPMNPWISFTFDATCAQYIAYAKEIAMHMESDTIFPYCISSETGGIAFSWGTEDDEQPIWSEWFLYISRDVCLSEDTQYKNPKLEKYAQVYFAQTFMDLSETNEEEFYQTIGWKPKMRTYEIALQLLEPNENMPESGLWNLQVVVRSTARQNAPWHPYRPDEKENDLQEKDRQSIEKRLLIWQQHTPFIGHGHTDYDGLPIGRSLTEDEAYTFLMEIAPELIKRQVTVLLPVWWSDIQKKKWTLQATVGTQTERSIMPLVWQDFKWKLALGDETFSEAEFVEALQAGRRMVRVGKEWMLLDEQTLKEIQSYVKRAKKKGFHLRDMIIQEGRKLHEAKTDENDAHLTDWDVNESFRVEIKATPLWHTSFRKLFDLENEAEISLGQAFHGHLRDYQQSAVNWLCDRYTRQLGAILADDMGLGKTVMVIGYFLHIREISNGQNTVPNRTEEATGTAQSAPILLICPTSLLGNWEMELQKFAPDLKVITHYGSSRSKTSEVFHSHMALADIILTSYGLVSNDFDLLDTFTWQSIVLDEAQNIKNYATKQSRAIRNLSAVHRVALTGTPVENRLTELWTLFDFVQPDYLGSLLNFKQEYILPIETEQDERKQQALKVLIQPFLLRRTKHDQNIRLDLPDKLEQKSFLHLNTEQTALYYQLIEECKANRHDDNPMKQKGMILAALNHFKMICDHPALYLHETHNHKWSERSPKLIHCMDLLENIFEQGEQALIFTQYVDMAKIIQLAVRKRFELDVPFFHGGLGKATRDRLVADFQVGAYPLLILSLKAGGTGLTLTRANHVIHFDRWWNPAVENQATDRVHRIGQENFVHVHKLIMKGTIEEKIDALMDKKKELGEQILSPESRLSQMSFDEFLRMVL